MGYSASLFSRGQVVGRGLACALGAAIAGVALSSATAGGALVAPNSKCEGQSDADAAEPVQEKAMRCLINYARDEAGARNLDSHDALERAAGRKAGDVAQCGFSHTACGHPADMYAERFGYTSGSSWQWGENLGRGNGERGSAREVFQAWLDSPPHRETILRDSFEDVGIGLKREGDTAYWVLQLGCRGC